MDSLLTTSIILFILSIAFIAITILVIRSTKGKFANEKKLLNELRVSLEYNRKLLQETQASIDSSVKALSNNINNISNIINKTNTDVANVANDAGFKPATDEEKKAFEEYKKNA